MALEQYFPPSYAAFVYLWTGWLFGSAKQLTSRLLLKMFTPRKQGYYWSSFA